MILVIILAIDTTSEWGGAGIFRDVECVAAIPHQGPADYSVSLFRDVDGLLEQAGVSLGDIDLFAASNGPGAFTGIRVGLAAVQGWSHALEKPWRGISIFEAMVEASCTVMRYALPILDARRGELYAGLFERAVSGPALRFERSGNAALLKPEQVTPFLENSLGAGCGPKSEGSECCTVIAREGDVAAIAIQELIPPSCGWKAIAPFLVPAISRLALRATKEGRPVLPEETTACYIRRTDAELHLSERASRASSIKPEAG
ncbi:MAG TPA: tRNA (adenosine(37)-N6)-threonylcarbamoyltransferase complex dimerization subunit type 1 TsaB [Terriglobia bacterium]|nr:tRNA (adenosine(37)-N6)-threonylcarbamoyltransferase complex dimerization subunit type 1 TsaB [Terriglobia bacterium]